MFKVSLVRVAGVSVLALGLVLATARDGRAQGFISPFAGFNFAGDSGCPNITGCQDKHLNVGISIGAMGDVVGFEEEFAYARSFFGVAPNFSSNVVTLMSNAMLAPKVGPARPYALVGIGLMKPHAELTPASLLETDNNQLGWDVGGGLMVLFGGHVGVRGDVRYLHAFQQLSILGASLGGTKLDFGRASAGLVLKF